MFEIKKRVLKESKKKTEKENDKRKKQIKEKANERKKKGIAKYWRKSELTKESKINQ